MNARRLRSPRGFRAVMLLSALILLGAKETRPPGFTGRMAISAPERTDAGSWDGTWAYSSVDARMALWIRTTEGKPELKLQYTSGLTALAFETDWNGKATFYLSEKPATFEIGTTRRDSDVIEGTWNLDVQLGKSGRTEKGTFTMYRATTTGRMLVVKFHEYDLVFRRGDKITHIDIPPAWTFVKVSKRQALWDELGF